MSYGESTKPGEGADRSGPPPSGFASWEEYDAWVLGGSGVRNGSIPGEIRPWYENGDGNVTASTGGTVSPFNVPDAKRYTYDFNRAMREKKEMPVGKASGVSGPKTPADPYFPFMGGGVGGGGLTPSYSNQEARSFQSERVLGRLEDLRQQSLNQSAYQPFLRGGSGNGLR